MSVVVTGVETLVAFAIACFVAVIVVSGAWTVQSFVLRCKISKVIDRASRANLTLAAIFKSNHVTKLVPCKVHANGYLETMSLNKKEPKHFFPILRTNFTRQTLDTTGIEDTELKSDEANHAKDSLAIAVVESQILPPSYLEGSSCPLYLVYDGVACAVTAEALVGLGISTECFKYDLGFELTEQDGKVVAAKKRDSKKSKAEVAREYFLHVMLPINPQLIKKFLTKLYDQSTVDGFGQDMWDSGYKSKPPGADMSKWVVFMGIGLCCVGAAMLIAAMFLG